MVRLVYENIGIGAILQRLGECRYANGYYSNPRGMLTQQTRLERQSRDLALIGDLKLLVFEFKAPAIVQAPNKNFVLRYENIEIDKLLAAAREVEKQNKAIKKNGEESVMIALIHAALPNSEVQNAYNHIMQLKQKKSRQSSSSQQSTSIVQDVEGRYLWLATPGTTVYIPLKQIKSMLECHFGKQQTPQKIDIEVLNSSGYIGTGYTDSIIPTCAKQGPLTHSEPECASCGGLYRGANTTATRRVVLELQLIPRKPKSKTKTVKGDAISYTFASLMKEFIECDIGHPIPPNNNPNRNPDSESNREPRNQESEPRYKKPEEILQELVEDRLMELRKHATPNTMLMIHIRVQAIKLVYMVPLAPPQEPPQEESEKKK